MKIAISQINPILGDINANKEKIIEQISIAKSNEADLIVFGEMAICGMPTYDLASYEGFVEDSLYAVSEISEYVQGIDVLIGTPTQNETDVFNTILHISEREIVGEYSKAMITSRDEIMNYSGVESEFFPEGELLENILTVKGRKVFLAIGGDIEYIDQLDIFNGRTYFEAIVNPTAIRYYHYVNFEQTKILQQLAQKVNVPIVSANLVGGNTDIVYYGGSTVVSNNGSVIAKAKSFEEDMLVVETEDVETFGNLGNKKTTPKIKSKETYNALILAIKDYFAKNGFKKACLGLSGGVDSALVAVLAVDALGKENVDVLLMPSQYSSEHSVNDALKLAENLGIKHKTIAIEPIYKQYMQSLNPIFGDLPFSVAEENLQSRIRGGLLMAYSNKFGNIVLNTTNKCEAAMGYGTLYGDTNGALSLLGDLYKNEIYDLCRLINNDSERIPQNIIDKAPSAELRPDQKDSDSLPEYEILDKLLYSMIEDCMSNEVLFEQGFDKDTVLKVRRLLKINEYKRFQIPPVIRLSKIVLGRDIVMPLTNKY